MQRAWATERLVLDPEGGEVTLAELERDLLMWCSDRRLRPTYTGITKMLTDEGIKRKLRPPRFVGIRILPPVDSGYRVPSQRNI